VSGTARPGYRPLAGVLAATAVALTGTRVSAIAVPWFVLADTGSAALTGLVAFCEMAPYVVVKALVGPLVDRVGPRRVSWVTDVVSATAAGAVVVLHVAGEPPFWVLPALVAVIGAARGPGDLAKHVMIPEAADRGRVPLERATGWYGVTERLASTAGPAAGGGLVALLGPLAGLGVSAGCFVLGSVLVGLALPRGMGRHVPHGEEDAGYWRRFGQGFAFLRGEPLLLALIVMIGVTNLLDAAFGAVLLPVWAVESGQGAAAIGLVGGVTGLGAVGGSLVATAVAHRMRRRPVFFVAFLIGGAPRFLILAVDVPMWGLLGVFAVAGFSLGFLNPILGAMVFERVPRRLLGRVNALGDSMAWAGIPLGGLLAGMAVTAAGPVPVLVGCAVAYFLTTNVTGLRREWRQMDRLRGRGASAVPDAGAAGTAGGVSP
jgi:MFS family permease